MIINNDKNLKVQIPILYSFRRCPFAMRARLAILSSRLSVIIREVSLKNKPKELLRISPSRTVPCLQTYNTIITESMDIMLWALRNNDPEFLLSMPKEGERIIRYNDNSFKKTLDRTKYSSNFKDIDITTERNIASEFLNYLDSLLTKQFLFGDKETLADVAIIPFIRQYAFIDSSWFNEQKWTNLINWLNRFLSSSSFNKIQLKYPIWVRGEKPILFPT